MKIEIEDAVNGWIVRSPGTGNDPIVFQNGDGKFSKVAPVAQRQTFQAVLQYVADKLLNAKSNVIVVEPQPQEKVNGSP